MAKLVGVKVWIYEGEVLPTKNNANANVKRKGAISNVTT